MPSASGLDAVTVDALGTLVELDSPGARLREALAGRGVERAAEDVEAAFGGEVEYYLAHKVSAGDAASLERLRRECTRVFLEPLGTSLDPADFTPDFLNAMVFQPCDGAAAALEALRAAGLALACVSDWDIGLEEQLERAGVRRLFSVLVSSAELGVEKPDPAVFHAALDRLRVPAKRAVHVGDGEADREGARRAGLAFEPVPLATLPARLGL